MPPDLALPTLVLAAVTCLLLFACWHDVATRTLPDTAALLLAAAGIALQAPQGGLGWAVVAAGLVFLGAAAVWAAGALGGGDVKLLGACALVVGPAGVPAMLLATAIAGGGLACIYLLGRRRPPNIPAAPAGSAALGARIRRAELRRLGRGGPLPYAVAIAAGTLFTLMQAE